MCGLVMAEYTPSKRVVAGFESCRGRQLGSADDWESADIR